jgi:aminotransferase in exopolysaccharide biosynthesis
MIPLSVPAIVGNAWTYIKDCLDSGWVSSAGQYVNLFESTFATFTGALHAVACTNGTAALHVALRLAGVKPGEEVIVPTLTFIATINPVSYLGAHPVFMDCDDYYNIDVEKVDDFLKRQTFKKKGGTYNRESGRRIAAIVPVHVFGNAARVKEIVNICSDYGISVVEDASEALGTFYLDGIYLGSHVGIIGDIGCFSFNGNKMITTGSGGMIVTNKQKLADAAHYLTTQAKDDELRYIHNDIGYNYRLSNIQSALGVAQMEKLSEFIRIKQDNFAYYSENINPIEGLTLTHGPEYASNNHWLYALQINRRYKWNRDGLMDHLAQCGIQTRPVWQLNHLQRPYRHCQHFHIERAFALHANTLNIPSSINLTKDDIDFVVNRLKDV